MDTKALRQKILDLAIRGKLVPQDPNDEPASVLLERIREQKKQMVKEGKLKAKDIKNDSVIFVGEDSLHYEKFADDSIKCIEDEIPFELPEGWAWSRLGILFLTVTGSTPSTKDSSLYGDDYPFYKPADLDAGFSVFSSEDTVSEKGYLSGRILPECSVLVTCIGATIGKTGYIRSSGICNQQINAILPNEFVLPEYTYFCMCSEFEQQQIFGNSSATTLPILNKSKFDNLLFPLPPKGLQKIIVEKIEELLCSVEIIQEEKRSLQETIKATQSKILDLAIRGQLVPQNPDDEPASVLLERIRAEKEELIKQGKIKRDKKESIIFKGEDNSYYEKIGDKVSEYVAEDIPLGWSIASFSQANMFSTETIDPSHFSEEMFELYSVPNFELGVSEIIKGQEIGSSKQSICENDVLVCKINPHINRVWITGHITSYRILGSSEWIVFRNAYLFAPYMQFYFSSSYFRELLLSNVSGVGGSLMRAQPESVKKYPVLIPPYKEQVRIAKKISELFKKLNDIEKNSAEAFFY